MPNVKNIATVINSKRNNYQIKDETARNDITELAEKVNDLWNVGQSNVLYVSKRNSRFATINEAVEYAKTYCTTNNRVIICIAGGIYQEYIDLDYNPGIDFYGVGNVILQSSVAWRLSTLRCSNAINVYNISFENYYTPATGEHAGYALHADPVTGVQTYKNCYFYSNNNSAIGVGMGSNGQINFYDCQFRGYNGGIYIHNNVNNGTQGQWARFYNCHSEALNDASAIRIDDAARLNVSTNRSVMGLVFVNCSGNNNGVTYRYNNPTESLPYVPENSANFPVFLYTGSENQTPALNKSKQNPTVVIKMKAAGVGDEWFTVPDAYKYSWTVDSIVYKDWNSNTNQWGSVNTFSGSWTCRIDNDRPDYIYVFIPGLQLVPPAERTFTITLTGAPIKTPSLPYTIHAS